MPIYLCNSVLIYFPRSSQLFATPVRTSGMILEVYNAEKSMLRNIEYLIWVLYNIEIF